MVLTATLGKMPIIVSAGMLVYLAPTSEKWKYHSDYTVQYYNVLIYSLGSHIHAIGNVYTIIIAHACNVHQVYFMFILTLV